MYRLNSKQILTDLVMANTISKNTAFNWPIHDYNVYVFIILELLYYTWFSRFRLKCM